MLRREPLHRRAVGKGCLVRKYSSSSKVFRYCDFSRDCIKESNVNIKENK